MISFLSLLSITQVLVEFDDIDWRKREWLSVNGDTFSAFLVEKSIVWTNRKSKTDEQEKKSPWLALVSINYRGALVYSKSQVQCVFY